MITLNTTGGCFGAGKTAKVADELHKITRELVPNRMHGLTPTARETREEAWGYPVTCPGLCLDTHGQDRDKQQGR